MLYNIYKKKEHALETYLDAGDGKQGKQSRKRGKGSKMMIKEEKKRCRYKTLLKTTKQSNTKQNKGKNRNTLLKG